MKQTLKMTGCIAAALALGGCQNFISALGFAPKESTQSVQMADAFGSEELEAGRLALKQGHVAHAIQQFRLAALNEAAAPDAFNGLGVAYARLGRADLAERYFKIAVELDTSNPKFAANLARFYGSDLGTSSRALAMREQEAIAVLAKAEQEAAKQGLLNPLTGEAPDRVESVVVNAPTAQIERESKNALRLTTSDASTAQSAGNTPEVAVREAPVKEEVAKPERPRISLVGRVQQTRSNSRPARITVSRAGGRWASRPRAASYPVRVALKRED